MPVYNITVKDTSADIVYAGQWTDTPTADALLSSYLNGTCHSTDAVGSTASISFYGTAIYVYGARRPDHDAYTVALDGQINYTGNGFSATALFQQLLYNATNLAPGQHGITLTDTSTAGNRPWLDIDYMIITAGNGDESTISTDTRVDDTAADITYTSLWNTSDPVFAAFWNSTGHVTNATRASATIPFSGNAIMVYGSTDSDHGPFAVSIDNGPSDTRSGLAVTFRAQNLLYYAGGLSSGNHTATIVNMGNGSYLDLDYAVASDWTTPAPPRSQTSGPASSPSPSRHPTSVGAIAGGVIGGVVVLVLTALALWLRSRRTRKGRRQVVDLMAEEQLKQQIESPDPLARFEVSPFLPPSTGSATAGHSLPDMPLSGASYGSGPGSSRFQSVFLIDEVLSIVFLTIVGQ
ncbi:hypothetical protein OE88DRAFT_1732934 [Heliocybe sulcata]|uniref:Uncharacterized protein n=1 Tax=Heliocybe sulcata TaxID=5364 RepID=A0A5C3NE02_9AGAM|nr:hypothetical protein OE88DRAFT_1732934 [Heliocybe sulcata]